MKRNNKNINISIIIFSFFVLCSCTKYEKGFLSPYFQYPLGTYTINKGRAFKSDAINPDGSSLPFKTKLIHVYNEAGEVVDDIFFKSYPVSVWSSAYNATLDSTFALISAKRIEQQLPAIRINESNGVIEANAASINLPAGKYAFDVEVSNNIGVKLYEKIVSVILVDAAPYESSPTLAATSEAIIMVGNESSSVGLGALPVLTVTKTADNPWVINVKIVDKNGVPFNPLAGEIIKRPNTGLNPNPAFLQNLQDYTRSYEPTATEMKFPYAVTPMPIASLGNGFNMYYRIPTQFVSIDGRANDTYSCNVRFSFRAWVPGTYDLVLKIPNVTHR